MKEEDVEQIICMLKEGRIIRKSDEDSWEWYGFDDGQYYVYWEGAEAGKYETDEQAVRAYLKQDSYGYCKQFLEAFAE